MKTAKSPFNIKIMDLRNNRLSMLKPVKVLDIHEGITNNFHDEGLFSIPTFGRVGSDVRDKNFSYIDIKTTVLHPVFYTRLVKLKGLYEGIMSGKEFATWDDKIKDFVKADELDGDTGYAFFMEHWKKIVFTTTSSPLRDDRIKLIYTYKDVALVDKVLVLPAGLRDFEIDDAGRQKYDDVNNLYFRILSISNTIVSTNVSENLPILNNPRYSLQLVFNEIYDHFQTILSGKTGFLQTKWGSRRIFNGTRNVISSMDPSCDILGAPNQPGFTDTVVGIYQLCKAVLPLTIFNLKNSILQDIFNEPGRPINLIDKKTLNVESVKIPTDIFDQWNTMEGLEKVINGMSETQLRHRPLEIEGRYLALIYIGPDKSFKIFNDISTLPKSRDIKNVFPLNLVQLIYLSGYKKWNTLKGLVTRYPITGIDSIYPCTIYVKTTIKGEIRYELNDNWELDEESLANPAVEFPKEPYNYLDTLIPHHTRLQGMGADFDGDTASFTVVTSDEANSEIESILSKKEAYIDSAGLFRASADVETPAWVLRSMTGT